MLIREIVLAQLVFLVKNNIYRVHLVNIKIHSIGYCSFYGVYLMEKQKVKIIFQSLWNWFGGTRPYLLTFVL